MRRLILLLSCCFSIPSFGFKVDNCDTLLLNNEICIIERETYNEFESKLIRKIPEPWGGKQSYRIKGCIPRGLRIVYNEDFEYSCNDEIVFVIDSQHLFKSAPDSACMVQVTGIRQLDKEQAESIYGSISKTLTRAERKKRIEEKSFPRNHSMFLINGLNADIYLIVRKKRAEEFLSTVLSGCDLSLMGKTANELIDMFL